jgi:hypothetical protein
MGQLLNSLLLLLLILVQVTLLPVNLAFVALIFYNLFIEKVNHWGWLLTIGLLLGVFGNFNLGRSVIALNFGVDW